MGYRSVLRWRWTRRDRMAIVVVAVTVAFLTGAIVVVDAAAVETTTLADEYGPAGYATIDGDGSAPASIAPIDEGTTFVGVPAALAEEFNGERPRVPPADMATLGTLSQSSERTLAGRTGQVTTVVQPREGESLVPPYWVTGPTSTAETLGVSSTVHLESTATLTRSTGVPLRGALAFFAWGSESLLTLLRVLTAAAAVLVAGTVYSVARMTVQDRRESIHVLRATGATPRHIYGVFLVRSGAITATGVLLGYGIGVVVPNVAVNVAVFAGVPVSMSPQVTPAVATTLLPSYVGVVVAGMAAGVVAVRPAVRGRIDAASVTDSRWLPSIVRPRLLGWRAFVPATSALSVFVVLAVLFASLGAAVGPLVAPAGATVTQPDAPHPVASTVPAEYADVIETTGTTASPELLLFSVRDGQPFLSRGADFRRFAAVRDVELVAGHHPNGPADAVIGTGLASSLDVELGETVLLGGSTTPAITRVTIVGMFSGQGLTDDQLVVPLETATHLSGKPSGTAQFIRVADSLGGTDAAADSQVVAVETNGTAINGTTVAVTARVANLQASTANTSVTANIDEATETATVSLDPLSVGTVSFNIPVDRPGNHTLSVGNYTTTIQVRDPSTLTLADLPERVPPDTPLVIQLRSITGSPVANATVTVGPNQAKTNASGVAVVRTPEGGEYELTARTGNRSATRSVTVATNATRTMIPSVSVSPSRPSFATRPTVAVSVTNPWQSTRSQTFHITPPGETVSVTVPPGTTTTQTVQLQRQPPGTHDITVRTNGNTVAETSFTVQGDDRLASAVATHGIDTGGTGIGRALQSVVGNVQVLVGAFIALGALVTIGTVTAGFAYAVRARRHTIGVLRATGATPRDVLARVTGDALRVGVPALLTGMAAGYAATFALAAADVTTVFGVRMAPRTNLATIVLITATGLGVVVLGALAAAYPLVVRSPRSLIEAGEHS